MEEHWHCMMCHKPQEGALPEQVDSLHVAYILLSEDNPPQQTGVIHSHEPICTACKANLDAMAIEALKAQEARERMSRLIVPGTSAPRLVQ